MSSLFKSTGFKSAGSFLALFWAVLTVSLQAHEIPNDVTVQIFLKPEGQHLHALVRVPLQAMRDIEFPQRNGYLDFDRTQPLLHDAATLWISDALTLYEEDAVLAKPQVVHTQLSLESDRSFGEYDAALAHIRGARLSPETNVVWNQTLLDIEFDYAIASAQAHFSLRSGLARLGIRVVTALRFVMPDGPVRAFEFTGNPGLLHLDPGWWQAASRFIELGFRHILDGTDHLLFLLCLVIPFRRLRPLIAIISAFTVAHSITLIASAYDLAPEALWFPPLIETLIAASIVYMALENIVRASESRMTSGHRWMVAFAFGLVHGFGFSFALRQTLQFAGSHLLTSLLSFNIGVELGQLLVLAVCVPLLDLLFRFMVAERIGSIILSALIAHTGWHWLAERGSQLAQFHLSWPTMTAAFLATAARWLMAMVAMAAVFWFVESFLRNRRRGPPESAP